MIRYSNLGLDKKLRDIVFAGSHDAGITSGGSNEKTQSLDIAGQAHAGVRLFDLRIMGEQTGKGSAKITQLAAYHGDTLARTSDKIANLGSGPTKVEVSKLTLGTFGLGLNGMLDQAKTFVTTNGSEFLIFKFDKCTNWHLIAEACVNILGTKLYTAGGDLNRKTLGDLQGKVIVLFSGKGYKAAAEGGRTVPAGILQFSNLYDKEDGPQAYDRTFQGMQYFGKGGTSVNPIAMKWNHKGKIAENESKQGKLMHQMVKANASMSHSSDVLGMMYWTSTGIMESIKDRNDDMWTIYARQDMRELWQGGVEEAIRLRAEAKRIKTTTYSSGTQLKSFMPNIIMIDFADKSKCKTIYALNNLATTLLVQAFKENKA
jgi:hypothetical protein